MNPNLSPQDVVQAQLATAQTPFVPNQGAADAVPPPGGSDPTGEWQPSSQMMQAAHQAAAANDVNTFNSLLRSAAQQRDVHARAQVAAQSSGKGNRSKPAAGAPAASSPEQQQRLAAALATMQQAAAMGVPVANAVAGMAVPRGMTMAGRPGALRAAPPFMPERLDRFESFLGNFIGALGEGMSIQQAAQATLRNLRAQQMLQARLMAQAAQTQQQQQQMALAAQARQGMPGGSPQQPDMQTPQMPQRGQTPPIPQQQSAQVAVHRQKLQQHLQQHHAMKRALIELLVEKHSHGKR